MLAEPRRSSGFPPFGVHYTQLLSWSMKVSTNIMMKWFVHNRPLCNELLSGFKWALALNLNYNWNLCHAANPWCYISVYQRLWIRRHVNEVSSFLATQQLVVRCTGDIAGHISSQTHPETAVSRLSYMDATLWLKSPWIRTASLYTRSHIWKIQLKLCFILCFSM